MAGNKHVCETCQLVFSSGVALNTHSLTCARRPPIKLSFYGVWSKGADGGGASKDSTSAANMPIEEEEQITKILPLSQPLLPFGSSQEQQQQPPAEGAAATDHTNPNYVCDVCQKTLPTARGLKSHRTSCLKKQLNRQPPTSSQPSQAPQIQQPSQSPAAEAEVTVEVAVAETQGENNDNGIWGPHTAEEIKAACDAMYEEIVFWKNNIFDLPSGAAGKRYIRETTRLIEVWLAESSPLADSALKLLMCMPKMLLQKPYRKSKTKQHSTYLNKRLDQWENGNFEELMKENRDIQHKLRQSLPKKDTTEHIAKCFAHLMLQGKVHAALRLLDKNEELGLAELNAENITKLTALHPEAADADESILMSGELPYFDPIVFQNIDEAAIAKAAHRTRGAAGPSGLDADGWRRMLVSKNYGESGVRKLVKRFGQQFPR